MKRIFFISILLSFMALSALPVFAAAEDEILPKETISNVNPKTGNSTGGQLLPTGNLKKDVVPQAISIALALGGTVSFGVFVYAGVMLIIAQGNEEEITKFKNVLIWSIVGLIFITVSYGLVRGIMQLVFK